MNKAILLNKSELEQLKDELLLEAVEDNIKKYIIENIDTWMFEIEKVNTIVIFYDDEVYLVYNGRDFYNLLLQFYFENNEKKLLENITTLIKGDK